MHAFEAHFHSDRHQFNQKSRRAASHIELKVAEILVGSSYHGGFQLEFVSISQVINHMTCFVECSHWLKLQHSDWRANLVKDFLK